MIEHRMPIPARAYNAAVDGHVCGPEDVDFGQKVVHLVKYDRAGNEVSFESQVTQDNKIYVIHDDFTLSSNVIIPVNCVLEFDGGSISGAYDLTGQNTSIVAAKVKIFSANIIIKGDWNIKDIYDCWFDLTSADNTQVYENLLALSSEELYNEICIENTLNVTPKDGKYRVKSNTKLIISGNIKAIQSELTGYQLVAIYDVNNVELCGSGSVIGDKRANDPRYGQWGHCVALLNANNVIIRDLIIKKAFGDSVYICGDFGNSSKFVKVINVKCSDNHRQGISIVSGEHVIIENCTFVDIASHFPSAGIDIELEGGRIAKDIIINNCYFENNWAAVYIQRNASATTENSTLENFVVSNCRVKQTLRADSPLFIAAGNNIVYDNIVIDYSATIPQGTKQYIFQDYNPNSSPSDIIFNNIKINAPNCVGMQFAYSSDISINNADITCNYIELRCRNINISNSILKSCLFSTPYSLSVGGYAFIENTILDVSDIDISIYSINASRSGHTSAITIQNKESVNLNNVKILDINTEKTTSDTIHLLTFGKIRETNVKGCSVTLENSIYNSVINIGTDGAVYTDLNIGSIDILVYSSNGITIPAIVKGGSYLTNLDIVYDGKNINTTRLFDILGTTIVKQNVLNINTVGTFGNKPSSNIYIGFQYFCTSGASIDGGTTEKQNIIIYYTGSGWVDANGNTVVAVS